MQTGVRVCPKGGSLPMPSSDTAPKVSWWARCFRGGSHHEQVLSGTGQTEQAVLKAQDVLQRSSSSFDNPYNSSLLYYGPNTESHGFGGAPRASKEATVRASTGSAHGRASTRITQASMSIVDGKGSAMLSTDQQQGRMISQSTSLDVQERGNSILRGCSRSTSFHGRGAGKGVGTVVFSTPADLVRDVQDLRFLGQGAQGVVYEGIWQGATVAVKFTVTEKLDTQAYELLFSKMLSHPNVVQTFLAKVAVLDDNVFREDHAPRSERSVGGDNDADDELPQRGVSVNSDDGFGDPYGRKATFADVRGTLSSAGARPGYFITQMVMELCDQGSLHSAIVKGLFKPSSRWGPKLALRALVRTAREVAQGMYHLHCNQVVHGDLKPANIMLVNSRKDRRGYVAKVGDFGLAQLCPPSTDHISNAPWGTLMYTAPERLLHGKLFSSSDVYSFGVVLWEMYHGKRPFEGLHAAQIIYAALNGQAPLQWAENAPEQLVSLANDCMSPTLSSRPPFDVLMTRLMRMEARVRQDGMAPLGRDSRMSSRLSMDSMPGRCSVDSRASAFSHAPASHAGMRAAHGSNAPSTANIAAANMSGTSSSITPRPSNAGPGGRYAAPPSRDNRRSTDLRRSIEQRRSTDHPPGKYTPGGGLGGGFGSDFSNAQGGSSRVSGVMSRGGSRYGASFTHGQGAPQVGSVMVASGSPFIAEGVHVGPGSSTSESMHPITSTRPSSVIDSKPSLASETQQAGNDAATAAPAPGQGPSVPSANLSRAPSNNTKVSFCSLPSGGVSGELPTSRPLPSPSQTSASEQLPQVLGELQDGSSGRWLQSSMKRHGAAANGSSRRRASPQLALVRMGTAGSDSTDTCANHASPREGSALSLPVQHTSRVAFTTQLSGTGTDGRPGASAELYPLRPSTARQLQASDVGQQPGALPADEREAWVTSAPGVALPPAVDASMGGISMTSMFLRTCGTTRDYGEGGAPGRVGGVGAPGAAPSGALAAAASVDPQERSSASNLAAAAARSLLGLAAGSGRPGFGFSRQVTALPPDAPATTSKGPLDDSKGHVVTGPGIPSPSPFSATAGTSLSAATLQAHSQQQQQQQEEDASSLSGPRDLSQGQGLPTTGVSERSVGSVSEADAGSPSCVSEGVTISRTVSTNTNTTADTAATGMSGRGGSPSSSACKLRPKSLMRRSRSTTTVSQADTQSEVHSSRQTVVLARMRGTPRGHGADEAAGAASRARVALHRLSTPETLRHFRHQRLPTATACNVLKDLSAGTGVQHGDHLLQLYAKGSVATGDEQRIHDSRCSEVAAGGAGAMAPGAQALSGPTVEGLRLPLGQSFGSISPFSILTTPPAAKPASAAAATAIKAASPAWGLRSPPVADPAMLLRGAVPIAYSNPHQVSDPSAFLATAQSAMAIDVSKSISLTGMPASILHGDQATATCQLAVPGHMHVAASRAASQAAAEGAEGVTDGGAPTGLKMGPSSSLASGVSEVCSLAQLLMSPRMHSAQGSSTSSSVRVREARPDVSRATHSIEDSLASPFAGSSVSAGTDAGSSPLQLQHLAAALSVRAHVSPPSPFSLELASSLASAPSNATSVARASLGRSSEGMHTSPTPPAAAPAASLAAASPNPLLATGLLTCPSNFTDAGVATVDVAAANLAAPRALPATAGAGGPRGNISQAVAAAAAVTAASPQGSSKPETASSRATLLRSRLGLPPSNLEQQLALEPMSGTAPNSAMQDVLLPGTEDPLGCSPGPPLLVSRGVSCRSPRSAGGVKADSPVTCATVLPAPQVPAVGASGLEAGEGQAKGGADGEGFPSDALTAAMLAEEASLDGLQRLAEWFYGTAEQHFGSRETSEASGRLGRTDSIGSHGSKLAPMHDIFAQQLRELHQAAMDATASASASQHGPGSSVQRAHRAWAPTPIPRMSADMAEAVSRAAQHRRLVASASTSKLLNRPSAQSLRDAPGRPGGAFTALTHGSLSGPLADKERDSASSSAAGVGLSSLLMPAALHRQGSSASRGAPSALSPRSSAKSRASAVLSALSPVPRESPIRGLFSIFSNQSARGSAGGGSASHSVSRPSTESQQGGGRSSTDSTSSSSSTLRAGASGGGRGGDSWKTIEYYLQRGRQFSTIAEEESSTPLPKMHGRQV